MVKCGPAYVYTGNVIEQGVWGGCLVFYHSLHVCNVIVTISAATTSVINALLVVFLVAHSIHRV